MKSYFDLCESWWTRWLDQYFDASPRVRETFSIDAAPEPYLTFGSQVHPLCVLTTNPGAPMPHQRRERIHSEEGVVSPTLPYADAAYRLADFYSDKLRGAAATRIDAQQRIAADAGFSGVLQVECIPWHSSSLPEKARILELIESESDLREYVEALRRFLAPRPTLTLSAVSPKLDLSSWPIRLSPWLSWQIGLLGIDPPEAEAIPLTRKDHRVTSLALVETEDARKAMVLMMGGNHFPSAANSRSLVDALAHR